MKFYNAGTTDEECVESFVARQKELDTLLRRLGAIGPDEPGQHHVLIGTRGMGKTTLLRRTAIAVKNDPGLSARFVPLTFREEQYNVLYLGDFWRNCGEALAEWAEATGKDALAARLDAALPTPAWAGDDAAGERFAAEMAALGRRALLLVDNLDLILDALPDEQRWVLRRHLQDRRGPVMIGAATQPLKHGADRDAAFYEFFQPHHLEPLDVGETERCMRALAARRPEHGPRVLAVLNTQPERLRTLHVLTGGNPRVLALIYRLLETAESKAAMADLEILLDQVTPYYKARIEEYQTAQQRAVIDAIALHWDPVTVGELSRLTGIPTTTLSGLLIRLRDKDGLIEAVETSGASAGHQLIERFLNIWYLMRHGTRRAKQKMRWLVGFLTSFYSPDDLADIVQRARAGGLIETWAPDFKVAFDEALIRCGANAAELSRKAAVLASRGKSSQGVEAANSENLLLTAAGVLQEAIRLLRAGDIAEALVQLRRVNGQLNITTTREGRILLAHAMLLEAATHGQLGDLAAEIAIYDELIRQLGSEAAQDQSELVATALFGRGLALSSRGNLAAAIASHDDLIARFGNSDDIAIREKVAQALGNKVIALSRLGNTAEAINVSNEIITRFSDAAEPTLREQVAVALFIKGVSLSDLGDLKGAIAMFDELIVRFGATPEFTLSEPVAGALFNKGVALGELGDMAASVAAYSELLSRFNQSADPALRELVAKALLNKGAALDDLGDRAGAIAAHHELEERFGDSEEPSLQEALAGALANRGITLSRMGDPAAAVAAYDEFLARFGKSEDAAMSELIASVLLNKSNALDQMGESGAAIATYDNLVTRFAHAAEATLKNKVTNALLFKGMILNNIGDDSFAVEVFEQALASLDSPKNGEADELGASICIQLGNLILDLGKNTPRAETLLHSVSGFRPIEAHANLAWLCLLTGRRAEAEEHRRALDEMPPYGRALLDAGLELARDNFGTATEHLAAVFGGDLDQGDLSFDDDINRLLRLADMKGYGERLLAWMEETGVADRIAPVHAAYKAYLRGEKHLLDVNPEVRQVAQVIYKRLDAPRRHQRGDAPPPEKTRRKRSRRSQ